MKEFQEMFRWFNDSGFQANIGALRQRYPEVQLQSLQWLYNEGWNKRARRFMSPPQ